MNKVLLIFAILLLAANCCYAKHLHKEKYYQAKWCEQNNGIMEYKLPDKTRVDCLTDNYAVEFDFASKWAEAIGQSLYYGIITEKKPAVVLIIERQADIKHYHKIKKVADKLNITVWTIK